MLHRTKKNRYADGILPSGIAGVKAMTKREKQLLRMVFESWREHTVESHASRFRKKLALEQRGTQSANICSPDR